MQLLQGDPVLTHFTCKWYISGTGVHSLLLKLFIYSLSDLSYWLELLLITVAIKFMKRFASEDVSFS